MRRTVTFIIIFFVVNHLVICAQELSGSVSAPSFTATPVSEIILVGKEDGKKPENFQFKMGETLTIKASGKYATFLQTESLKSTDLKTIALYLDGVRMENLTISAVEIENGKELLLNFHLARNSEDSENREAWDRLISKQDDYLMKIPVTLAFGSQFPVPVNSLLPFSLFIVRKESAWGTIVVGLAIFLLAFYLLVKSKTALRDGEDSRYSLGKSQMAFWGLLVVLAFSSVWFLTGTMERIPPQVLILLGISGATGLSSIVIGESKQQNKEAEIEAKLTQLREEQKKLEKEQLEKPNDFPESSKTRLSEIKEEIGKIKPVKKGQSGKHFWSDICNDGQGFSFHRLQVVIWTIVLGVIFVASVAKIMSMPEIPETLLVLMGISNGTYLGFKIPEKG